MSDHSKLGPSQAKRWINCTASVAECEKAPPQAPNYAAAEGTVAHSIAEKYVTGKIDSLAMMELIGTTVVEDGLEIEIIEEMFDGAVEYKDLIDEDRDLLTRLPGSIAVEGHAEIKVHALTVDERVWGTSDYVLLKRGKKLIVYDYKFGQGVIVDPEENEQGALYLIGVIDSLVKSDAFDELEIVIHQPRGRHVDGPVRRWIASKEWLAKFRGIAKAAAAETLLPTAKLVAGDWCRWCAAKAYIDKAGKQYICPAVKNGAQEAAMVTFDVGAPAVAPKTAERLPEVRMMLPDQLSRLLDWEPAIKSLLEAAKDVVRERLSNGLDVPGWKLVQGREGNREWISEEEVVAEFSPTLGKDALYEKKLLSPAKIEKIVGKKHKLDHLVTRKPGDKAIARDRDPRPAAPTAAQDAFKVIETTATTVECEACAVFGMDQCSVHSKEPANDLMAELNGAPKKEPMWPA